MLSSDKILMVKQQIEDNEHLDNVYWEELVGNQILQTALNTFRASDWDDLKKELKTWTSFQQSILAYALISPQTQFEFVDPGALFGFIFTLVEDNDANAMIQEIEALDNGKPKTTELLISIKMRILRLKKYTESMHIVLHDYNYYLEFIDKLLKKDM
jgi:hypothetical protein